MRATDCHRGLLPLPNSRSVEDRSEVDLAEEDTDHTCREIARIHKSEARHPRGNETSRKYIRRGLRSTESRNGEIRAESRDGARRAGFAAVCDFTRCQRREYSGGKERRRGAKDGVKTAPRRTNVFRGATRMRERERATPTKKGTKYVGLSRERRWLRGGERDERNAE